ncbi:hypothetical protein Tco_1349452, partial [Tanacetum coccineum]
MKRSLQDQANDIALWEVLKCKFEKSSIFNTSCRDDDFHSQHHDDHQDDGAPPEGEKREWDAWVEETIIDEDEVIPEDETPELITNDRAPGPDGFTAAFFKKAWDVVGGDITCTIRDFFSNGKLLKELNHTIISLIPKGLGDIVSINQSAFVPGRRIFDNILLTQELMRNYNRRRGPPKYAFKVDIQKACDTVDWSLLETILI